MGVRTEALCPLEQVMTIIDGKWTVLILWHLRDGPLRFSEINKKVPSVTQKVLTQKLRHLENEQFISRIVYPVMPPHVEYELAEKGRSFLPILLTINQWGWETLFGKKSV